MNPSSSSIVLRFYAQVTVSMELSVFLDPISSYSDFSCSDSLGFDKGWSYTSKPQTRENSTVLPPEWTKKYVIPLFVIPLLFVWLVQQRYWRLQSFDLLYSPTSELYICCLCTWMQYAKKTLYHYVTYQIYRGWNANWCSRLLRRWWRRPRLG